MGFIDRMQLRVLGRQLLNNGYGKYLLSLAEEERE